MSREVRLAADRPHTASSDAPVARVRIELASFDATSQQRRRVDALDSLSADDLRPARGMVNGLILGAGLWVLISCLVWLIMR